LIPPSYLNVSFFPVLSSNNSISRPAFKKASSFRRVATISYLISIVSKISESGKKVIVVPFFEETPVSFKGSIGIP
jgi:hypothetical protein